MKIAIHRDDSSWSHSWIEHCKAANLDFGVVNCYDSNIMETLRSYDVLLWQFDHHLIRDITFARHILFSAQEMNLLVFPDFRTCWHYDDKIAQFYLLDAVKAPTVESIVLYNCEQAETWLSEIAEFPIVAKLRRGSGSHNVRLLKSLSESRSYCKKMFSSGIHPVPGYFSDLTNKVRSVRNWQSFVRRARRLPEYIRIASRGRAEFPVEKGYVYFQKFLPNNDFDTRITVIGDRAFAFRRMNRPKDFRASGSGLIDYQQELIDPRCIQIAFEIAGRLGSQCLAFDFVCDQSNDPRIIEVSYTFLAEAVRKCAGYWTKAMRFVSSSQSIEALVLEDLLVCSRINN